MKLIQHTPYGNQTVIVHWGDHWPACERCRSVDLERSGTFVNACAQGSPLLMEELTKRQAPVVKQKAAEVKAWAQKAGVFKTERGSNVTMKFVEDK